MSNKPLLTTVDKRIRNAGEFLGDPSGKPLVGVNTPSVEEGTHYQTVSHTERGGTSYATAVYWYVGDGETVYDDFTSRTRTAKNQTRAIWAARHGNEQPETE